eukprot:3542947-Pyramimonas_sp.AAC.1
MPDPLLRVVSGSCPEGERARAQKAGGCAATSMPMAHVIHDARTMQVHMHADAMPGTPPGVASGSCPERGPVPATPAARAATRSATLSSRITWA